MRHRRADVVETALRVLDQYGLADLTMRRLAAELDVRPSALYHHFPDKQRLLAAVADELLRRGERELPAGDWRERVSALAAAFRDALLACTDGAELVTTVRGFGLGAVQPYEQLCRELTEAGFDSQVGAVTARTVVHYVLGHTGEEQTRLQAQSSGAIQGSGAIGGDVAVDDHAFALGLGLILDGVALHAPATR